MVYLDDSASYEIVRNKENKLEGNDKVNIVDGREEDEDKLDDSKNELYEMLPPHCGGHIMIKPKRTREPTPTRVIPPAECFGTLEVQ